MSPAAPAASTFAQRSCLPSDPDLSGAMTVFLAAAVGVIVLNLFAAQPLAGPISAAFHLPHAWTGLVAMSPQLGYAMGLLVLVPLSDLLENRRLIVRLLLCCAAMLAVVMCSTSGPLFLVAALLAGAASSAIQILVPMAALMSSESRRGRTVGNVMSGLMVGILLARPLASFIADLAGWRVFYGILAVMNAVLSVVLYMGLPTRQPVAGPRYGRLIASLATLLRDEAVLRRRSLSAALCMGAFSAFWTAIALCLTQAPFNLTPRGIALFALAGAAGVVTAPLAGRAGDRGWTRPGTILSHLLVIGAFSLTGVVAAGWGGFNVAAHVHLALYVLAACAILLDAGLSTDQTLGRRVINLLNPGARGRLNALFVGLFFVGGAIGSLLAGIAWTYGGWSYVVWLGMAFGVAALMSGVGLKSATAVIHNIP